MKKLFILMGCAALMTSCFNMNIGLGKGILCKGPVVEKEIEGLTDFNVISVNGSADLFYTQADTYSVKVEANEEVFDHIDYKVEQGVLQLSAKNNENIRAEKYDIYVCAPDLTGITVNGASDVIQRGEYQSDKEFSVVVNGAGDLDFKDFKVPAFSISVNGAGDIKVARMDVEKLTISVNGAGDAVVSGKAASAHFSVNGAGDIDAHELECNDITTHKGGIASIRL